MKAFIYPKFSWAAPMAVLFLLLLWQLASLWVNAPIILPSPWKTAQEMGLLLRTSSFYKTVGATLLRGLWGFLIPLISGLATGILSGKYPLFSQAISPLLRVIKSTPVMSVILLAMIWFPTGQVPIFVCFLTTFPIITEGMAEGVRRINKDYLELARLYKIQGSKLFFQLYMPGVLPFLLTSVRSTLGLTWKVIIAAEVLSQPRWGVGSAMQSANVNLLTARVFSWTLVAICLSWFSSLLVDGFIRRIPGASYET